MILFVIVQSDGLESRKNSYIRSLYYHLVTALECALEEECVKNSKIIAREPHIKILNTVFVCNGEHDSCNSKRIQKLMSIYLRFRRNNISK